MAARHRQSKRTDEDNAALERDVHDALDAMGWRVPEDDDGVRRAEEALAAEPVELPEALADPQVVLDRAHAEPDVLSLPGVGQPDIDATLARAAREAGELTPEIEARMRRDREEAERESGRA